MSTGLRIGLAALLVALLVGCGSRVSSTFSSINTGLVDGGPAGGSAPQPPAPLLSQGDGAAAPQMHAAEVHVPTSADTGVDKALPADAQAEREDAAPPAAPEEPAPPAQPRAVEVNPFVSTSDDALSTFALDVDTASYAAARNYLSAGQLPPPDTVRVEEFVNYFDYDYPAPAQDAFGISVDGAPSPFGQTGAQIVRVGIQGQRIDASQRADAVLTFVIDISGSMEAANRLPLVKDALRLLVEQLRPSDQVAIVVYGDSAALVLEHTSAADRATILGAIDSLHNTGSTNAEAGLQLGYEAASKAFKNGANNRVILCSDGVANVGATGPDAIRATIRDKTAQGIYLTTVGFGMGDYNDYLMEQLADDGNGNYAYVDDLDEAQRIFVEGLTGMLQVIARDAKVQVDFNPAVVSQYRLLGYENRAVADADFRNDKVDAGEIGAGHSVTALYEVVLAEQAQGTLLTVHLRYHDVQLKQVREVAQPFERAALAPDFARAAPRFQQAVAVAAFAEHLRQSGYAHNRSLDDLSALADRVAQQLTNDEDVQELARLVLLARQLDA